MSKLIQTTSKLKRLYQVELEKSKELLKHLRRFLEFLSKMKDDLLDVERKVIEKSKQTGEYSRSYVSILRISGTKIRLKLLEKERKQLANEIWSNTKTIKGAIDQIVARTN
ncbi:unnamed protein product [Didymodactylos carnosus]|uniref:Uncharacterized protein n=1 Tax=Didymodactylos carnosus TaxID=1234261 RepID=A0A814VCW3_9BILA|nr:unnamed protein product [Didymodactylos carnosus]CAF1186420.1 unnamed protein product [Didymodactylos carnosus]CAF3838759.1 unnamed protein product [Didymodactylos carnosus]CAF3950681.1 unnamed protein product [Didymodactylos carnosus]